jgi:hypothetical protein
MKTLPTICVALALSILSAKAVSTIPTDLGTNITNDGTSLVDDISKSVLGSNSPATMYDWLTEDEAFDPGLISSYNSITGSSLPAPNGPDPYIQDDSAAMGTYPLDGSFYAVLHYGVGRGGTRGSGGGIVAYYVPDLPAGSYGFPASGLGPNGCGGLSSVRIWKSGTNSVPEGGATFVMLGIAGLALVGARKLRREV